MEIRNKKTAVDLTDLALGIVVLGIVVAIGSSILINMRDSQITNAPTYSVNLESVNLTALGGSARLSTLWGKSVDYCQNGTSTAMSTGNYSYTVGSDGVITLTNTTSVFNGQLFKCNYTVYNVSDPRFAVPNKASIGLEEYGNWFKILVIVGVAAVILGLIFMAFGNRSSGSSQGY